MGKGYGRPVRPWQVVSRLDLKDVARPRMRNLAVCLAVVLLLGVGAVKSRPAEERPMIQAGDVMDGPGPSAAPASNPQHDRRSAGREPAAVVAAPAPTHRTDPTARKLPAPAPAVRWLPTGTGMWLHDWRRSEQGHAFEVVQRALRADLTHLYVQTGSSKKGWIGQEVLSQLLPATKGTDLKVIAWDFPKLDEPEKDARRLARAAFWHRDGVPMVAAVAPDVETSAEGARATPERVRRYYTELRKALPKRTAILATVPWPSEKRTASYPYAATAPFADAFVPMAYWYNRSPTTVTATSMSWLARFGKPVMPVGQGYDGRIDAPYLKADLSPRRSVEAFSFAARSRGAQSISLWSWQTTGPEQWAVLAEASRFFVPVQVGSPVPVSVPNRLPARPPYPRRSPSPGSPVSAD